MALILATWMYTTPKYDKVLHTQTGRDSDSRKVQDLYWRCVFCLFASSLRVNGPLRHLLFVNQLPPARIDGIDLASLTKRLSIEIVVLDRWTRPPADYHGAWNTQFAILDIIDWLGEHVDPADAVLCLDADCVFTQPLDAGIESRLRQHGTLLYTLDYPSDYVINGLSRNQLADLSREYAPGLQLASFSYSGGEFFCCLGVELNRIARLARAAFTQSLERHAKGEEKFREEAHLLSFVYHQLGYQTHTADDQIRRIWTDRRVYCDVDGNEDRLPIWHLPAEKDHGFKHYFRRVGRGGEVRVDHSWLRRNFRIDPPGACDRLAAFVRKLI